MKRILLMTDFSENANNAIDYAVKLYKDVVCEFYILHTYMPRNIGGESMMMNFPLVYLHEIEKKEVENKLQITKNKLKEEHQNGKHLFFTIASFNLLIPGINEAIHKNTIDLIIMGTKGATGAKEIFIGTNTMDAIKNIKLPLIVVPDDFEYEKPKEILFPTNFELSKTNKHLSIIKEISKEYASKIHILKAYNNSPLEEKQKEIKVFLDDYFNESAHTFYVSKGQKVIAAIEIFEMKYKVNLLVMIYNKHTLLENLLFKPIINQIVYHTKVPFLVLPSEEIIES